MCLFIRYEAIILNLNRQNLKAVEQAIYEAKLPGVIPQKADASTIKIPIPKCVYHLRIIVIYSLSS